MEHAFSRIMAVFTAVLMFFLVPLVISIQRQEHMIQLAIMQDTVQFVDSVCNMGAMTEHMYEDYQNQIRRLQNGLDVHMVHTVNSLHMGENGIEKIQKIRTESELKEILQGEAEYLFQKGDYFWVEVRRNSLGLLQRFYEALGIRETSDAHYVYYGGSIRYEIK